MLPSRTENLRGRSILGVEVNFLNDQLCNEPVVALLYWKSRPFKSKHLLRVVSSFIEYFKSLKTLKFVFDLSSERLF